MTKHGKRHSSFASQERFLIGEPFSLFANTCETSPGNPAMFRSDEMKEVRKLLGKQISFGHCGRVVSASLSIVQKCTSSWVRRKQSFRSAKNVEQNLHRTSLKFTWQNTGHATPADLQQRHDPNRSPSLRICVWHLLGECPLSLFPHRFLPPSTQDAERVDICHVLRLYTLYIFACVQYTI